MRIQLEKIEDKPFRWVEVRAFDSTQLAERGLDAAELLEVADADWRGEVRRTPPGFLLRARLSYTQSLACTRCLDPRSEPAASEVELLLVVEPEESEDQIETEKELEEQDLGIITLREPFFETEQLLDEQILLNLPMRVLCRPDCAGLCAGCGHNLNRGPCDCPDDDGDPRWDGLRELRDRLA